MRCVMAIQPPTSEQERTLRRFRTAMKFSLWAWVAYWPGGGLILLYGGLGWVSLLFLTATLLSLVALLASGVLRSDSSRNMKEFFLERPLYLLPALIVFIVFAALVPSSEGVGLFLFSGFYLGGIVLAVVRLLQHTRALGQNPYQSRADQLLILYGVVGLFALFVFLDAFLPLIGAGSTGTPGFFVAAGTWVSLFFPSLLLVASRPLREPIKWSLRRRERTPTTPAAAKRRKTKAPSPLRAD